MKTKMDKRCGNCLHYEKFNNRHNGRCNKDSVIRIVWECYKPCKQWEGRNNEDK
jgi:hypothetical protein